MAERSVGAQPVLYVLNSASMGGANRSLSVLLAGLDRARYEPRAVVPHRGPFEQHLAELDVPLTVLPGIKLTRIHAPFSARMKGGVRSLLNQVRLAAYIERHGIRLVHTNTIFPLSGAIAARLAGLPHVWHLREGLDTPQYDFRLGAALTRRLLESLSTHQVCISEYVRQVSGALEQGSASVVHNALDGIPEARRPGALEQPLVACVGLIGAKKRTADFVAAAGLIAARIPGSRFLVAGRPTAGEESYEAACRKQVGDLGLQGRFEWPGFVADHEALYGRCDLLLHPGVHEAFGRVLIEAMARGIPVVTVASGAAAEVVSDGTGGRVVQPDDPAALADAACEILESRDLYRKLSEGGRRRALAAFTPERHVSRIEALYARLLQGAAS